MVGHYASDRNRIKSEISTNSMKIIKRTCLLLVLSLLAGMLALLAWLSNPLDKNAWRVPVSLPVIGTVQMRAFALIQLGTSPFSRSMLNHTQWQTKQGLITVENQADLMQLNCQKCHLNLKGLSSKPIAFDTMHLTVKRVGEQLSGELTLTSEAKTVRVLYAAQAHMQGIDLNWTLPSTLLADLLTPLKTHSPTIQKAHVTGTLAATGTLHWPSQHWSAKPTIDQFDVTGLGTENLRTGAANYTCPQPNKNAVNIATSSQVWLDKKGIGRWLPMAVIIAEDAKFRHHKGYDFETISYLLAQENPSKQLGGSTISQQLAKYFFTSGERLWIRKIDELLYAVEMESTLGKERILNLYLNTVDWGPGICGAYDASQYYFGVNPNQLNAVQAAWLAGIVRNPHHAWAEQYLTNQPDYARIMEITRFMPERARNLPLQLSYATPSTAPKN